MNCVEWEERIGLYAGDDVSPAEAGEVERHVAECGGCQLFLSGLRESLSLVREAHSEPIESAHFAAVRARVLAEIEGGRARGWRFGWMVAMAAAAAAVVVMLAIWPRPEQHLAMPMPSPPAAPVVARVELPRPRRVMVKPVAQPEPTESMVVKLLTNDPDVVIYWITGTKGE